MQQLGVNGKGPPPNVPNKPSSLRNFSTQSTPPTQHERLTASDPETQEAVKKTPPPLPKPRRSGATTSTSTESAPSEPPPASGSRAPFSSARQNQSPPHVDLVRQGSSASTRSSFPPPVSRTNTSTSTSSNYTSRTDEGGYVASARRQIASAYSALPAIRGTSPTRTAADQTGLTSDNRPVPPRRGISSYPAAAARWATGATGGDPAAGGDGGLGLPLSLPGAGTATYDKKLELWKRRWARAEELMNQRGVVLRSWRVGGDVMDECVQLVRGELTRMGH